MTNFELAGASTNLSTLWECYAAEQRGELEIAELMYVKLLYQHSKARKSDGIILIHYLDYIRRMRGLDEAVATLQDLQLAESDQITTDVRLYSVSALKWSHTGSQSSRSQACEELSDICRSSKGKSSADCSFSVADFLAFSCGNPRSAILETSRLVMNRKISSRNQIVWEMWNTICNEFGGSISANTNKLRTYMSRLAPTPTASDAYFKDEAVLFGAELDEHNEISWLDMKPSAYQLSEKYQFCEKKPESALLEYLVDPSLIIDDERDGGDSSTNHIYRPDVTKMMRFVPAEDVNRKVEIPRVLRSFAACLPHRGPKGVNATTLAESSLRLLVSISLPRPVSEEMLANVDRRTRLAVDQKRRHAAEAKITGAAMPVLPLPKVSSIATKEEQPEDGPQVKREEIAELPSDLKRQKKEK